MNQSASPRVGRWAVWLLLGLGWLPAGAQEVRLLSGTLVPGEIREATPTHLVLQSPPPRGRVRIEWSNLAPGTRYRHEPAFRSALPYILQGASAPPPPAVADEPNAPPTAEQAQAKPAPTPRRKK